jgi:3-methyladenine DNA glycosylase/8-oxoguanine DNA glycosylase
MSRKAVLHLKKADKIMGRLIEKAGPFKMKPTRGESPYEALVRSIVFQQLSGKAAQSILNKVLAQFPTSKFPQPHDILKKSFDELRAAGLSRAKVQSIQQIAEKTLEGVVPDSKAIVKMTEVEILERLTTIRGVGPWTVHMLLIFHLGRPDVLPTTDYGVRKGFALTYKRKDLPAPKELAEFGVRWAPYRSVAAWYLWRSLEL